MNKLFDIINKIITYFLTIFSVVLMIFTIVSVTTFNKNDKNVFGYKAFVVLSDSMKETDFSSGDVVIVKKVDPTTLKVGDIISYISKNQENYGDIVTHKIRSITKNENGDDGFITYGTTTNKDDELIVTYPYVTGKYQFSIPKIGTFFNYLKTVPGYIACILIPFLLLILLQGINTVREFKKYKKEQLDEIKKEKEKLDLERKQMEEMMNELMKMKNEEKEVKKEKATKKKNTKTNNNETKNKKSSKTKNNSPKKVKAEDKVKENKTVKKTKKEV